MKRVINKKTYNTETADRIATDDYSDGTNQFNCGRTADLYRTKKGNYFVVRETCWQGEHNSLEPLAEDAAIAEYESMYDQIEEFEAAFPGVKIEDA